MGRVLISLVIMCLMLSGCENEKGSLETQESGISKDELTDVYPSADEYDDYPSADEYDEIVLEDERYCLCKKVDIDFDSNKEKYGIYDKQEKSWAMEYRELSLDDMSYFDFCSHGEGVFSYKYSSYYGTVVFLSAEKGGTFSSKNIYNREGMYFDDGMAFILCSKKTKIEDGRITPDSELFLMDTSGNLKNVLIPGFDTDTWLYWSPFLLSKDSAKYSYARAFFTKDDQHYVYIYFYDTNESLIIDDQRYTTKLNYSDAYVNVLGDSIYIGNMRGNDGKKYFAIFDREGNVTQEPSLM